VLVEATRRFGDAPDVMNVPMLVAAIAGLGANVVAFFLLRGGSRESINVEGAYLEVLADLIGSMGVIIGAIVIGATGWDWVDPLVGVLIGVWILPRTWRLGARALRILVQAAPPGLDLDLVETGLASIAGVVDVHDLHVWTLTSDMEVASAHLRVNGTADSHFVLDQARAMLHERHGIAHATFQNEPEGHHGCDEVAW
jgi:cobalt-zinc-cadmium efflux system protein